MSEYSGIDASLPERLERLARMAENADYWTDTHRLMPAEGVADLLWEALGAISGECPLGDDCDLTVAWMAGSMEGRRKGWNEAIEAAAEDIDCACPHKASVLECIHHNSRTRWEICPEPNCAALAAESVRALKKGQDDV